MLFTMLDEGLCAIHAPTIIGPEAHDAALLDLEGGTPRLHPGRPLLETLRALGFPLEAVVTGGAEPRMQAREQWQKGTNFFAMAPGKVIGYARNENTYREMEALGFRLIAGADLLADSSALRAPGRVAVAIEGAELSRGGGGARCMTLPIRRSP